MDTAVLIKKEIADRVEAIGQGLGRMLPREAIERYRSLWHKDPVQANVELFAFELRWNGVPLPEGTDEQIVDTITCLGILRFGSDEALGDWGLGVYGHPSPLEEGLVN